MLVHQLQTDKIAFYPNSIFVANRWNCDFYWILPDSPSGISIFYCPESKSLNAYELEKERNLSSVDKIKNTDIEKLTKQKIHLPTTVMDLIWMTQNFQVIIALCFGPTSHSAKFLQGWSEHMYDNRIIYSSNYSADPSFFAKVLFSIDFSL
jgi:hypothetical protein